MGYNLRMFRTFEELLSVKPKVQFRFTEGGKTVTCPFCGALYTDETEVREIPCEACTGIAKRASAIEIAAIRELERAKRNSDVKRLREIAELFPPHSYMSKAATAVLRQLSI